MSDHPRTIALRQYAREAIKNAQRTLAQEEKDFAAQKSRPIEQARNLDAKQLSIKLAKDRVSLYLPILGSEHCPICFVFGNKNVSLVIYSHTGESAAPDDVVTCSECAFSNSIPLV